MFYRLPIFIIDFSITEKKNIQYDKYVSLYIQKMFTCTNFIVAYKSIF